MKLRRTLLIAGVFALMAMIYVPTPRQGYRFIFSENDTSIAFFQLLVNVVFAALLGVLLANISKRGALWAVGSVALVALVALVVLGLILLEIRNAEIRRANAAAQAANDAAHAKNYRDKSQPFDPSTLNPNDFPDQPGNVSRRSRSPSPGPTFTSSPATSIVDQLLKEATEVRGRGDTTTALARLQEASENDPTNAAVLAEIARTYEAMQLFDRSNEMWRKLQEMGPSAGEAYELADRRLKLGVPPAAAPEGGSYATLADIPKADGIAEGATSPYATSADFARYAMRLREQTLLGVEPLVSAPTSSRPATQRFPWKTNIVTTVFWVDKKHARSAWDANWKSNYGGFDTPDSSARRNYIPVAFIPRQNPFYCALPYNDVSHGQFKPEAPLVIPWFKQAYTGPGQSVCKGRWVAIRKGNRTCYAQWEDCGPFSTDHFQYVFQNERPKPNANRGAGLNISPAVRDYLGLAPTDVTDWQFIEVRDVPLGPWRSYGDNNHFVIARRQTEQRLAERLSGAAKTTTTAPAQSAATSSALSVSSSPTPLAPDFADQIPTGSIFGITDVNMTEKPDPDAERTNLALQIGIKKQSDAAIDHTKVKIQVFFYDTVDDREIKLTDADVNYEWLTPKHDWTDTNPEILSVSYERPKTRIVSPETTLPPYLRRPIYAETGGRRYLGYRILLYYDDKLQAAQAEPARLLQLFPPSGRISPP